MIVIDGLRGAAWAFSFVVIASIASTVFIPPSGMAVASVAGALAGIWRK